MNLIKLLIPKEKIVGIDMNGQKLRMLYLDQDASGNMIIKGQSETELDDNTIVSGEITDKKKLSAALSKLKVSFAPKKLLSNFAIVTIPPDRIYTNVLEFPKVLDNEQILEAISTNAADMLPFPLSECYFDWETIGEDFEKKQVLISLAQKKVIDSYIEVLKGSGFELIALETHFLSLERVIDLPDSPAILIHLTDDGISCTVYEKKRPFFSRFETWQEAFAGKTIKNITDLKNIIKTRIDLLSMFHESKKPSMNISKVFLISHGYNTDLLIKKIGKTRFPVEKASINIKSLDNSDWLLAAGAAARAFIPRSDDTIISLLPIGTESLYETQKAISFSKSILFFICSLCAFYISIMLAFFLFITSLENSLTSQLALKNSIPISEESINIENNTKEFNAYISDINKIKPLIQTDYPSIIEKIGKLATVGTYFTNITVNDSAKSISVSGTSSSRESYKYFKSAASSSADFTNITVISGDIAKKNDINFTFTAYFN